MTNTYTTPLNKLVYTQVKTANVFANPAIPLLALYGGILGGVGHRKNRWRGAALGSLIGAGSGLGLAASTELLANYLQNRHPQPHIPTN